MNSVHNPIIQVKLRDGEIAIRELSWPDALNLYQRLMTQTKAFLGENGQLSFTPEQFVSAIQENIELGTWLVKQSTGKDENWLMQRSLSEVLDVATEAAVLNIGIIVERIKNAKSRLRKIVAGEENQTSISKPSEPTGKLPT